MGLETDGVKIVDRTRELEVTIFEDDQVILLGDGVDFLPPFEGEGRTGGVLAATVRGGEYTSEKGGGRTVRDSVKDMRELSLGSRVPSGEGSLEFFGDQPATVDLDRGPGNALGGDGVCQGREGQLVGEEGVSPISEEPEALCDAITIPKSEGDHVVLRRMEDINEFGQRLEGGRDSSAGAVSESGVKGKCTRTVPVGDRFGGTRTVAPFENGIGAFEGSDLE